MSEPITWKTEWRRLGDLIPWEDNPRQIRDEQGNRLKASLRKFGYSQLIEIEPDNMILDGHQRDNLMKIMNEFTADTLLEVRVSSRKFTEKERREYVLYKGSGAVGEYNMDVLSGWEVQELKEYGGFTDEQLGFSGDDDEDYTRNIEAPIYVPKKDKPNISQLFDDSKTRKLIEEIDCYDLPEEEKEFLRIAARRHTILNYKNIAEYYAHSDKKVQRLMENSALVIIDFGRAIELGYVRLSEEVAKQYGVDYG